MKIFFVILCLAFCASAFGEEIIAPEKKPYLLSDKELLKMKDQIRHQCRLPKQQEHLYPWYYHYELGLALQKKQDWQRALDSFLMALDRKDQPKRGSRIYGMWFLDYYPYYNIALAHYHLKNWKCASESYRLSQMLEDLPDDKQQFQNLLRNEGNPEIDVNKESLPEY